MTEKFAITTIGNGKEVSYQTVAFLTTEAKPNGVLLAYVGGTYEVWGTDPQFRRWLREGYKVCFEPLSWVPKVRYLKRRTFRHLNNIGLFND